MSETQKIILNIGYGKFPATTGLMFTQDEIDSIKEAILNKQKEYDNYFQTCILTRFVK